jgi:hypothetical protein
VGGQVLVSPTLIAAADLCLILGDEVEVHAKGMREPLRCRDLLGHEDYPELRLEAEEASLTPLARPLACYYLALTGKHLDWPLQPASLVSLASRRPVVEVAGKLAPRANLMLRLTGESGGEDSAEFYARVLRPVNKSHQHYPVKFTSPSRTAKTVAPPDGRGQGPLRTDWHGD